MDIVKKHIVPIICAIIAIVCVVLIFVPLGGMYEDLTGQVAASKATGDGIEGVLKQQRNWPTLSSKEEDRLPLRVFPTDAVIKRGEEMTLGWRTETDNFRVSAVQLQQQALIPLVPSALPGAGTNSQPAYDFQDAYLDRFGLKTDPKTGLPDTARSIFNTILKGGLPPTAVDVTNEQTRVAADVTANVQRIVQGALMNPEEVATKVKEATDRVAQNMRTQLARKYVVYVDPQMSLQPWPNIAGNSAPKVNDIFLAQVSLWVQEEVCRAIAETNRGAKQGVVDAPIKRLVKLTLPTQRYTPVPAVAADVPALPPLPTAKVEADYLTNPLGHKNNDYFDVLRFDLEIVCEAQRMPDVMAGLSRGRYIMFRNAKMLSLDSSAAQAQGFLYGNKPVIALTLEGQYLMLRPFIGAFMPPDIIRGLNVLPGAAGQPGMPGGMPGMPGMPMEPGM
ncbi:MAG TPA: hypothetical protein VF624_16170 [Tepidisphaeraceae bacterium]